MINATAASGSVLMAGRSQQAVEIARFQRQPTALLSGRRSHLVLWIDAVLIYLFEPTSAMTHS